MRSRYDVQMIAVAGDCNAGFDLDRCDGESCINGGLAPGEGLDGVDNALTGLAPVLAGVGGNLGGVDQALYNGLCNGTIDWVFEIDTNLEENCASVTPDLRRTAGSEREPQPLAVGVHQRDARQHAAPNRGHRRRARQRHLSRYG